MVYICAYTIVSCAVYPYFHQMLSTMLILESTYAAHIYTMEFDILVTCVSY